MEKQFADYETSKMLDELKFNEKCIAVFDLNKEPLSDGDEYRNSEMNSICAPLWQQVKEWLWDVHEIRINTFGTEYGHYYKVSKKLKTLLESKTLRHLRFNSPIMAEKEAIKKAVLYLYSRILNECKATNE